MKPLRIGWATPWNVQSAVAQSAASVAFELARRGHTVTVLRTETGAARQVPSRPVLDTMSYLSDWNSLNLTREFDVVVAHVGNHYPFHGDVLAKLPSFPIVGIFHDVCLAHLMRAWVGDDQAQLRAMVRDLYRGTPAAEEAFRWNDLDHVMRYHPMIEWAAARTVGAVVHASHYQAAVSKVCDGPVLMIPLAFEVAEIPAPSEQIEKEITIAVVGHANSNKRIDQLLLGIGSSPFLRGRCRIKIIGEATAEMRDALCAYAAALRMRAPLFTGWVSDEDLALQLRDVDVLACLRSPVLEGASASLILALNSGRPTLVSNHGCYAEVPDDAALKCSPGHEALDVMIHLENLIRTPKLGPQIGARGRAFVASRHTASAYADALEPLLYHCASRSAWLGAQQALNATLTDFGLARHDPARGRILSMLNSIGADPRPIDVSI